MGKKVLLSMCKYSLVIILTHLYIVICAAVYQKLEGLSETSQVNRIENFMLTTKLNIKTESAKYLQALREKEDEETYWRIRTAFKSFPRTYLFVLATHTTLGNRHMIVQTWRSHLFYILSVPLGVVMYYVMIHMTANLYLENMKIAVMMIFRTEDDVDDHIKDFNERVKLVVVTLLLTLVFVLLLGTVCLMDGSTYLEEIYFVVNAILTISSSSRFMSVYNEQDSVTAFLSTIVYFTCILFAYINTYSVVHLFQTHSMKSIVLLCGGEYLYKAVHTVDEEATPSGEKGSVWDYYDGDALTRRTFEKKSAVGE